MKNCIISLVLMFCLLWIVPVFSRAAETINEELPNLELTVPDDVFYRNYLGLAGKAGTSFTLKDIKADILVIELFNMYCPYCQEEAPRVNELYEKMEEISTKGPIVKIIGLGASNTQFEVEHFRDMYKIQFPLFPDPDMTMYRALGGAGTPYFIGSRLHGGDKMTIVLRNSGGFYSSDDFLKELIEKALLVEFVSS